MYEYAHGGNAVYEGGNEHIIDLSANINPLGMPETVKEAVWEAVSDCARYPDSASKALREAIAAFEQVEPEWIFCGNGASDIIFRLPGAARAEIAAVTAPSFSDYERAAKAQGAQVVRHILYESEGFNVDESFSETVKRQRPGLVFLCNPNNPTGRLAEPKVIEGLLACCREVGAVLAVDECFIDFADCAASRTSKGYLAAFPNLIILKAFTKLFGLPGIRLGYGICADKALLNRLSYQGADWPVSTLAQAAGRAALIGGKEFIKKTAEYVSGERAFMEAELARLGYKVFPSEANYVFIKSPLNLYRELNEKGIRIRCCGNYCGLERGYYRIAVSTRENNERLLRACPAIRTK